MEIKSIRSKCPNKSITIEDIKQVIERLHSRKSEGSDGYLWVTFFQLTTKKLIPTLNNSLQNIVKLSKSIYKFM